MSPTETTLLLHALATRGPELRAHARRIVGDADAAEDVLQQAAIRVLAHPPRSGTEASLAELLFRSVHDLALRECRRRARDAHAELRAAGRAGRTHGATRADAVVDCAIQGEGLAAVQALLRLLTLLEREAVTAVHLEGRTIPEAASRLGVQARLVQRALGRAYRRLGRWCAPRLADAADPHDMAAIFKWVAPLVRAPRPAATGSFELDARVRESVA